MQFHWGGKMKLIKINHKNMSEEFNELRENKEGLGKLSPSEASETFEWNGQESQIPNQLGAIRAIIHLNGDELYPNGEHTGTHGNVGQFIAKSGIMYVVNSTRLSPGDGFHDHVVVSATSKIKGDGIYNLQGERVGDAEYTGGSLLQFRLNGTDEWRSCEYPRGHSLKKDGQKEN